MDWGGASPRDWAHNNLIEVGIGSVTTHVPLGSREERLPEAIRGRARNTDRSVAALESSRRRFIRRRPRFHAGAAAVGRAERAGPATIWVGRRNRVCRAWQGYYSRHVGRTGAVDSSFARRRGRVAKIVQGRSMRSKLTNPRPTPGPPGWEGPRKRWWGAPGLDLYSPSFSNRQENVDSSSSSEMAGFEAACYDQGRFRDTPPHNHVRTVLHGRVNISVAGSRRRTFRSRRAAACESRTSRGRGRHSGKNAVGTTGTSPNYQGAPAVSERRTAPTGSGSPNRLRRRRRRRDTTLGFWGSGRRRERGAGTLRGRTHATGPRRRVELGHVGKDTSCSTNIRRSGHAGTDGPTGRRRRPAYFKGARPRTVWCSAQTPRVVGPRKTQPMAAIRCRVAGSCLGRCTDLVELGRRVVGRARGWRSALKVVGWCGAGPAGRRWSQGSVVGRAAGSELAAPLPAARRRVRIAAAHTAAAENGGGARSTGRVLEAAPTLFHWRCVVKNVSRGSLLE